MRKFKIIAGTHSDENGNIFKKGSVVSSEHNLAKMFANKFIEVSGEKTKKVVRREEVPPVVPPTDEREEDEDEVTVEEEDEEGDLPLGKDVSSEFPMAKDLGFVIFRNSEGHFLVASAKKTGVVINKTVLRTKQAVNRFIQRTSEES